MNDPVVPLWSATVNYTLNSTTFIEGNLGRASHRQAGCGSERRRRELLHRRFPGESDRQTRPPTGWRAAGRSSRTPTSSTRASTTMTRISRSIQETSTATRVLLRTVVPVGRARRQHTNTPPSNVYPGFADYSAVRDFAASLTKVWGRHTMKTGFYKQSADEAAEPGRTRSARSTSAMTANNPIDSGFGYANAALGVFSSYNQASRFAEGQYIYTNDEAYIQDNWKIEQPADARLRPALRAPAAAVRDDRPGVELPAGPRTRRARRRCSTSPVASTASTRAAAPIVRRWTR